MLFNIISYIKVDVSIFLFIQNRLILETCSVQAWFLFFLALLTFILPVTEDVHLHHLLSYLNVYIFSSRNFLDVSACLFAS